MRSRIVVACRERRLRCSRMAADGRPPGRARNDEGATSMVHAPTAGLAIGRLFALLPGPAAAVDAACTTQAYGGAERVVTTPKPSGYQVTAVYGEGVYRASRCDASGDLIEGQTVAPIAEPDGDVALVPSTYSTPRGDGSVPYRDPRDPAWA